MAVDCVLALEAAVPTLKTRLAYAFAGVCPDVDSKLPRAESVVETCNVSPAVVVEMTA